MLWRISQVVLPGHNFCLKCCKISQLFHVCNTPFSSCVRWFDHPNVFSNYMVNRLLTDRAWRLHSFMPLVFFRHVGKIVRETIGVVRSLGPSAWNNSAPIGRIFVKFHIQLFFENLWRNFKFHSNRTKVTCPLHENQYTFLNISRSDLRIMRNISDKICGESQNADCAFSTAFRKSCGLWNSVDYIVELGRLQMVIWHMCNACWIHKLSNTHSQYVTLIALHCNNVCMNAPEYYVVPLPALF